MTPLVAAFLIALENADPQGTFFHRDGRVTIDASVPAGELDEAIRVAIDETVTS